VWRGQINSCSLPPINQISTPLHQVQLALCRALMQLTSLLSVDSQVAATARKKQRIKSNQDIKILEIYVAMASQCMCAHMC